MADGNNKTIDIRDAREAWDELLDAIESDDGERVHKALPVMRDYLRQHPRDSITFMQGFQIEFVLEKLHDAMHRR